MVCDRQSRAINAHKNLYSSRLAGNRFSMDEAGRFFSENETDEQSHGPDGTRKLRDISIVR